MALCALAPLPARTKTKISRSVRRPAARPIFGGLCARGRISAKIRRSSRKVQNLFARPGGIRQFLPNPAILPKNSEFRQQVQSLSAEFGPDGPKFVPESIGLSAIALTVGRAGLTALRPFCFEFRGKGGKFSRFPHVGNCHYFCGSSALSSAGALPAPLEMGKADCHGGPFPPQNRTKVRCARQNCLACACV